MNGKAVCWMEGKIIRGDEARVSVFDHGLLYGDGVFEGLRFYRRRVFRLSAHIERLFLSARAIALDIRQNAGQIRDAVEKTVAAFPDENGYLRLIVTRGVGSLGIDPRKCPEPSLLIIGDELAMVSPQARERGASVIIASTRQTASDVLDPRIKSLNYLNRIMAKIEANMAGADEALVLNSLGHVTEGTADNVFIVRNGRLLTPPVIEGALDGITRAVALELAHKAGIPAMESPLAPYDIYTADECFLTGTGAEMIPVRQVDGRLMTSCPGPVFTELSARFSALVMENGENEDLR